MSAEGFEHLLSLEDPAAGPALPIDSAAAERLVEAALAEAFPGDGGAGGEGTALGVTGASGALRGSLVKAFAVGTTLVIAAGLWASRTRPVATVKQAPALPAAAEVSAAELLPAPVVVPQIEVTAEAGPRVQASRGVRAPGAVTMPELVLSDLELLGAANTARRERKWREADALYGKVVERFPASSVSVVAALASGELRLDLLGDAEGARDRFRFATTRGQAHAADAYEGLVKACVALRDKRCEDEARAALEAHGGTANEKNKNP